MYNYFVFTVVSGNVAGLVKQLAECCHNNHFGRQAFADLSHPLGFRFNELLEIQQIARKASKASLHCLHRLERRAGGVLIRCLKSPQSTSTIC